MACSTCILTEPKKKPGLTTKTNCWILQLLPTTYYVRKCPTFWLQADVSESFSPLSSPFSGDHTLCHLDINLASKTTEVNNTSIQVVMPREWSLQKINKGTDPVCKFKEPLFEFEVSLCVQCIGKIREPQVSWGGVFKVAEFGLRDF